MRKSKKLTFEKGGFVLVTEENAGPVNCRLVDNEGKILVVQDGPGSHGDVVVSARIDLFHRPLLCPVGDVACVRMLKARLNTGSEADWSPVMQNGRHYSLRRIPSKTGDFATDCAGALFDRMSLGSDWQFTIGHQCIYQMSIHFDSQMVLYVPHASELGPAFDYVLEVMFARINETTQRCETGSSLLVPEQVGLIGAYALEDLVTGKVLLKNIGAGLDADLLMSS